MKFSLEMEFVEGARAYFITKIENGVKFYLTPKMKFERYKGERGYIRSWEKAKKVFVKIVEKEKLR